MKLRKSRIAIVLLLLTIALSIYILSSLLNDKAFFRALDTPLVGVELSDGTEIPLESLKDPAFDMSRTGIAGKYKHTIQDLKTVDRVTLFYSEPHQKGFTISLELKISPKKILPDETGLNTYVAGNYYYLLSKLKRGNQTYLASPELSYQAAIRSQ